MASRGEEVVDHGSHNQAQHHGDHQPAYDGDGKWLQHLGTCFEGERESQHAADSCRRRNQNGARRRCAA